MIRLLYVDLFCGAGGTTTGVETARIGGEKLLAAILAGYEVMHLSMGYDGTLNKKVCDEGFTQANAIIDRCAELLK